MPTVEWPFRAAEVLAAGALSFRELRYFHRPIYPGVWVPKRAELSAAHRARAAWLWSRRQGVLAGVRGLRELEQTLSLVDAGAESPYESLTRLLLIKAGFPRPQTQIPVYDGHGRIFARIDLGWPEYLVGVDFDGAQHWTEPRQWNWDVERYARIGERGWLDIRLTSGMLHNARRVFLERVGAALTSRGCPKTW